MALHRSGLMMASEEIDWLIKRCGKSNGEFLTFEEFVVLVKHWNEYNHEYLESRCILQEMNHEDEEDMTSSSEEGRSSLNRVGVSGKVIRDMSLIDDGGGDLGSPHITPLSTSLPKQGLASQILWTKYKV